MPVTLKQNPQRILHAHDVMHLPYPVQQYLRRTGALGSNMVNTVFLKQRGLFKVNGKQWKPIKARQWVNIPNCEFTWKARLGVVRVVDEYKNGKGRLAVSLLNLVKLSVLKGKEMDAGELHRFLTEIIWYPTAFSAPYISWKSVNDFAAEATLTLKQLVVSATFHFNQHYKITSITARRYRETNGRFELANWEIDNLEYTTFNSISLPYKAHVNWNLPEGAQCYYKLEITDISYNYAV
jgi:hypothetical protein